MTYEQTLDFLYSCHTSIYEDLTRIRYVLECLENPQETFPSVLIAGTNGKGSTAKIISTILRKAGYRVGCFTSPHLIDFGERITLNGQSIAHDEVITLTEEIKQRALVPLEQRREELVIKGNVAFFEMVTAMAFLYFARNHIDIAILEVGIGGRLDPTNIANPLVSVITNIGLDHQNFLGETIEEIATEKAGIIRENGEVVTSCQHSSALSVLESACQTRHATLYKTGLALQGDSLTADHEDQHRLAAQIFPKDISANGSLFAYNGLFHRIDRLSLQLAGRHQLANAAAALCTLELLEKRGYHTSEKSVRTGLSHVVHPGRLEILRTKPTCVVDIAHNAMGAGAIAKALTTLFKYDKLIIIFGVLHDKDVPGILQPLLEIADSMIFTSPHNTNRAETATATARIAEELVRRIFPDNSAQSLHLSRYEHWCVCESMELAFQTGNAIADSQDVICITGSNYTVSEAERLYKH